MSPSKSSRDPSTGGIGYIVRKFPVLSETFVLNEMLALEAKGVVLHVFSLQRPNDPRFHEALPKLKARVTYVPDLFNVVKLVRHNRRLSKAAGPSYAKTLLYVMRCLRPVLIWRFLQAGFVANEARRLKLRHLHAHFANRPATIARLAARLAGISFSFTAHAMDVFKASVDKKALKRKIDEARFVVTVSDFNKSHLQYLTNPPQSKIVRIYNGIDLGRFSPNTASDSDIFRIVTVARLVEKKGLSVLIEACRRLRDRGVQFRCDIVGKGGLRSQLGAMIKALKVGDCVHLVGPKTQHEVVELYHAAQLYVLPAVVGHDGNREGLPVSIVEALSCGLPVVSTPITGIPEAVEDGENGLLVPPGDPDALANAIERVIRDRRLLARLRAKARQSVSEKFDQRNTSASLHQLFEGVV